MQDLLQAVILAGSGNRLSSLTSGKQPKSLLPVANLPMIHYQLKWLERAYITNVIIITTPSCKQRILDYVTKVYEAPAGFRIEIYASEESAGTAEAIRSIKSLITNNFLVVSTDLIIQVPPQIILDSHRALNSSATVLFCEPSKTETSDRSAKEGDLTDFVGMDHRKSRLLYLNSKMDVDDVLSVRTKLLQKFPIVNIHSQLQDAHLYVFQRWVIDLIAQNEQLVSLRDDLLPLLIKAQYDTKLIEKEDLTKYLLPNSSLTDAFLLSTTGVPDGIYVPSKFSPADIGSKNRTKKDPKWLNQIVCSAIVATERNGFCSRANTITSYLDANIKMTKQSTQIRVDATAEISPKTQIGQDSMVGASTKIGERCSVKRSVVGSHCTIGKNCKIIDSVIMDHVVIEDNVKLEGCVVCNEARILEKSQLKECEVTWGYVVDSDTIVKGECFIQY